MWRTAPDDSRTIWMDITARDRNFMFSLFGLGRGVFAKQPQELPEQTYDNLLAALRELTDEERSPEPDAFANFGSLLFDVVLPQEIQLPLLKHDGPLVFSTHELSLPWELLCANDRFLSLKHAVSRQLPTLNRMSNELIGNQQSIFPVSAENAALIIANPTGDLPGAEDEAEELKAIFKQAGLRCDVLIGPKECTYQNVMAARLCKHPYRIIHFSGHAESLENSGTSGILLAGGRMIMAQEIQRTFKGEPLVFLNACWSAKSDDGKSKNARSGHTGSNIVRTLTEAFTFGNRAGRARAIIGSMWWTADDVARGLAGCFYQEMLAGHPLGEALRRARLRFSEKVADPALWSTYVLFGDPHQCFANAQVSSTTASVEPSDDTDSVSHSEPAEVTFTATATATVATGVSETVAPTSAQSAPDAVEPAAKENVAATPEDAPTAAADGEIPWSDEMRAAFVGAMAAMSAMNWKFFSTVHLVLGLTYIENGLIGSALTAGGVDPQAARRALRELFTIKDADHDPSESIISDNLKACFSSAQDAAREMGDSEVTELHVVAALLDRPEAGGTMLLGCLEIDLDELRKTIGLGTVKPDPSGDVKTGRGQSSKIAASMPAGRSDLMLPDGNLDLSCFDADSQAALEESTLMAYRSYWADLRSPHVFLGMLNRRRSQLAKHLVAQRLIDPNVLATSFLTSLTNQVDASMRQPKLHREFLSENALLTLRTARDFAREHDRELISEHDILSSILANESNVITTTLRKAGVEPSRLLW